MKAHDMIRNTHRSITVQTLVATTIIGASGMTIGCSSNKVGGARTQNPERLTMRDFTATDAERVDRPDQPEQVSSAPTSKSNTSKHTPRVSSTDGITLANAAPVARPIQIENPSQQDLDHSPSRSLQLLDAKIGDVNGKPIFTSSFFAPIEDRLLAEAQRLSPNEWRASAGRIIAQRLDGIIEDELLRAEALAALTPTQRVGLQAFLSNFRDNILSENLGSSQLATRRIQEREGISLDEALRKKEADTLVQLTLIREINRRVNVSWRDIQQRYERDIDKYAPPPSAVLRVIRTFEDETETVEQITSQLENGVPFAEIASSDLNNFNSETDGLLKEQIEGSFAETKFFGNDTLNDAAHTLSLGEYTGPVTLGSSLYWIMYEDNEQESISLYDAQLGIQRSIEVERRSKALSDYSARLQERARVTTREEVLKRLFEVAEQRYAPSR